jgi:hypothetical protein
MAEEGKKTKTAAAPRKPRTTKAKTEQPVNGAPQGQAAERSARSVPGPRMVSQDEIRNLAHKYWVERGRPHGGHEQDWYRAEQELRGKAS